MYLWFKILHIAAMAIWFTSLLFLPRLLVARRAGHADGDSDFFFPLAGTLYFRVMTPAGLATIVLGTVLIAYGPFGAWLPLKLAVVALAVLIHLYLGVVLHEYTQERPRHGVLFLRVVGWTPLVLLLALAALTAAKPATVAPLPPPPATAN